MSTFANRVVIFLVALLLVGGLGWSIYRTRSRADLPPAAPPPGLPAFGAPAASPPPLGTISHSDSPSTKTAPTASPASSLAEALAHPAPSRRKLALLTLAYEATTADAKHALRLLAQLTDPAHRSAFIEGMMAAGAEMAPAEAVSLLVELDEGLDREGGMQQLFRFWGADLNHPRVSAITHSQGNAFGLGLVVATFFPERGVAWAEGLLADEQRREVLAQSVGALSRSNPRGALDYLARANSPEERRAIAGAISRNWSQIDPASVQKWLETLPPGPERDAAQGQFRSPPPQRP